MDKTDRKFNLVILGLEENGDRAPRYGESIMILEPVIAIRSSVNSLVTESSVRYSFKLGYFF